MSDDSEKIEKDEEAVLEMRNATLKDENLQNRVREIDLVIKPGKLAIVIRPVGMTKLPLATAAVGLQAALHGRVLFQSNDWTSLKYRSQLRMRTRIGRIFERGAWLQNLTLFDNILLGPRHHTRDSEKTLFDKMKALADAFDLKLVNQRPAFVQPWQLRMFQWVRALIGKPSLIVAEHPFDGIPIRHHDVVFRNESNFRNTGGATLWVTDSPDVIEYAKEIDAEIFKVSDERLVRVDGEMS